MFAINKTAMVSCYVDAAALLVMVLLLFQSKNLLRRKDPTLRIFRRLCVLLTATCVTSFLCHAMYMQEAPWCHSLAIAGKTLWRCFAFLAIFLCAVDVKLKLYGPGEKNTLADILYLLPLLAFTALLAVNLFNGVLFTCTKENLFEYTWLYYLFVVIETLYFLVSALAILLNNKRATKICFIRVVPLILPVILGASVQQFFLCETEVLGFVISAVFTYIAMSEEMACVDAKSGLYNKNLLFYLYSLSMRGKYDIRSALILEMKGNLPAGCEILRRTVNRKNDVIRVEERKFLMFSGTDSRSALQLLSTHVEEAVAKQNAENPAEKVQITVRSRLRTGEEDTFGFIRSTVEEKDAGDPLRGVVSMISQLDRLDEELRLATDIQSSILPANFPAFPDRKEFDLYASMTPAKEVGGDFYDFFLIDRDHLGLVIADVSGKGVPAALFMMVSKTLIKNQLMSGCDPATALERVNAQLYERNSSKMFVTVWAAVLEISSGRGMACNAGHENPGIRRAGGDYELLIYKHGMFVGVRRAVKYENREFELHPGDSVFVYTDGVPEANRNDNEMFGEKRLADALNQMPDAEPQELIRHIREEVNRFADGAPQFDDITMLCLKYYGPRDSA